MRGRLHLCHDEEKTLTRLVDDWTRHVRAEPDSVDGGSGTHAGGGAGALLAHAGACALEGGRTSSAPSIEVSRDLDGRVTEPLEVAVGDRLRIGATQWDKQLFNGTIVTVEDLEVLHGESSGSRSGRPLRRNGDDAEDEDARALNQSSISDHDAHGRRAQGNVPARRDPRLARATSASTTATR